jgi:hypothetical protein
MTIPENIIDKINKAKASFKRIGYLLTHKKGEVIALLQKYKLDAGAQVQCIKAPCPSSKLDLKNLGQTSKALFQGIKGNDEFTKEIATLIAESEKAVKKTASFDGSSETVLQIAQDLKEAANTISPEEAVAEVKTGADKSVEEYNEKILKRIFFGILILAVLYFGGYFLIRKFSKK